MNDEQKAAAVESINRIRQQFAAIDWSELSAAAERVGRVFAEAAAQLRKWPPQASGGEIPGPRNLGDAVPLRLSPGYFSVNGGETWRETKPRGSNP